jgi:hypothetical protein
MVTGFPEELKGTQDYVRKSRAPKILFLVILRIWRPLT